MCNERLAKMFLMVVSGCSRTIAWSALLESSVPRCDWRFLEPCSRFCGFHVLDHRMGASLDHMLAAESGKQQNKILSLSLFFLLAHSRLYSSLNSEGKFNNAEPRS